MIPELTGQRLSHFTSVPRDDLLLEGSTYLRSEDQILRRCELLSGSTNILPRTLEIVAVVMWHRIIRGVAFQLCCQSGYDGTLSTVFKITWEEVATTKLF